MKNKAAAALGKMGKGKPKTMTPAAKAARLDQMEQINAAKRTKKEKLIRDAFIAGFEASEEGFNGEYGGDTSGDNFQEKLETYVQSVMQKPKQSSSKTSTNQKQ